MGRKIANVHHYLVVVLVQEQKDTHLNILYLNILSKYLPHHVRLKECAVFQFHTFNYIYPTFSLTPNKENSVKILEKQYFLLLINIFLGARDIIGLAGSKGFGGSVGAMAERRATHADSWYSADARSLSRYISFKLTIPRWVRVKYLSIY